MELKIYIDRLKDGRIEKLNGQFSTSCLGVEDLDISFHNLLSLEGEAYTTNDHLILRLQAKTCVFIPCAICNKLVEVPICMENFYHAKPLAEIPSAVFDFSQELREDLLLQIPQFAECNQGNCPEREQIKQYLKGEEQGALPSHSFQYPFSDLKNL